MGQPSVVLQDQIVGVCAIHLIPGPAGAPVPSPPLPFAAPLTTALAMTVHVSGSPVAVQGSQGFNTPPHVGLHPSDPYLVPVTQIGQVVIGSTRVMAEGKPMAYTGCQVVMCNSVPGQVVGSGVTVLVGS